MNKQTLRDNRGRRIGEIEVQSNGRLIIRDSMFHRKGEYDPKTNVTRDERGRRVGEGNLLTSLL